MRRTTLWLMSTIAALVLLFSYRTSLGGTTTAAAAGTTSSNGGATSSSGGSGTGTGTGTGGTTYQGSVASTRWGDVQVTITVVDGKITSVAVPAYPTGNSRDKQINARALPILTKETIS